MPDGTDIQVDVNDEAPPVAVITPSDNSPNGASPDAPVTFESYDDFFAAQTVTNQELITGKVSKLKGTLDKVRKERGALDKSLKSAIEKAGDLPDLKAQLEAMTSELELAQFRSGFALAASGAGLTGELELALLGATPLLSDERYRDLNGDVIYSKIFDQLKKTYPLQFAPVKKLAPNTRAGEGVSSTPLAIEMSPNDKMNDFIRTGRR